MISLILPIFLPHRGCCQDCLFCNQKVMAGEAPSPEAVRKLIETALHHFPSCSDERERQVAFYGGSFTLMLQKDQISYLKEVQPFLTAGRLNSIRLSTRPDALSEETLGVLKKYGVKTIEVGVQSMSDKILFLSRRGHTAKDSASAILRLRAWGFEVGVHLMIGLPGDSCDDFLHSLDRIIELSPDFVRIHPTLVLRGASLEALWKDGKYSPLPLDEAIRWLKKGVLKLEKASLPLARMGLQPTTALTEDLLAGPFHPALRQLADSAIFYDMAENLLENHLNGSSPVFLCHPKDLANLTGQRKENLQRLKTRFKVNQISILCREDRKRGYLTLKTEAGEVSIHRTSMNY